MEAKFIDKKAVCTFTQAGALNKQFRRGTGHCAGFRQLLRISWTDTATRRSYLFCVLRNQYHAFGKIGSFAASLSALGKTAVQYLCTAILQWLGQQQVLNSEETYSKLPQKVLPAPLVSELPVRFSSATAGGNRGLSRFQVVQEMAVDAFAWKSAVLAVRLFHAADLECRPWLCSSDIRPVCSCKRGCSAKFNTKRREPYTLLRMVRTPRCSSRATT